MPAAATHPDTARPGRRCTPARQALEHVLLQDRAQGDYLTLAQAAGLQPRQAHQMVRNLARAGLVEPCATVPTGARPRNVWRAAERTEPAHQFLARTLLEAWR
jgi:hypothetical protein